MLTLRAGHLPAISQKSSHGVDLAGHYSCQDLDKRVLFSSVFGKPDIPDSPVGYLFIDHVQMCI